MKPKAAIYPSGLVPAYACAQGTGLRSTMFLKLFRSALQRSLVIFALCVAMACCVAVAFVIGAAL